MENSRPGTTVDMVSAYRETTSETTTTEVATVVYKQNIHSPQETNWKNTSRTISFTEVFN